jgi:hypothetical protein
MTTAQPNRDEPDVLLDLTALADFADELNVQAQALGKHSSDLADLDPVLRDRTLPGQFAEAESLADVHRAAVGRVRWLVDQLRDLATFADAVTGEVAGRWAGADQQAADSFAKLRVDDASPIGRMVREL